MGKKNNDLEKLILADLESMMYDDSQGDDDNLVERTANIWRELLLLSETEAHVGTTTLMVDTFQRNVWAAMTKNLDMSDYRIVWEYDPETDDVSIYNYIEDYGQ